MFCLYECNRLYVRVRITKGTGRKDVDDDDDDVDDGNGDEWKDAANIICVRCLRFCMSFQSAIRCLFVKLTYVEQKIIISLKQYQFEWSICFGFSVSKHQNSSCFVGINVNIKCISI